MATIVEIGNADPTVRRVYTTIINALTKYKYTLQTVFRLTSSSSITYAIVKTTRGLLYIVFTVHGLAGNARSTIELGYMDKEAIMPDSPTIGADICQFLHCAGCISTSGSGSGNKRCHSRIDKHAIRSKRARFDQQPARVPEPATAIRLKRRADSDGDSDNGRDRIVRAKSDTDEYPAVAGMEECLQNMSVS
jgi:hypothetical protein